MKKIMKSKTTVVLTDFEKISESQERKLLGGFSNTITNPTTGIDNGTGDGGTTNNCQGGNCRQGCGIAQNLNCIQCG